MASSYLQAILAEASRQGEVRAEAEPPGAVNPLEAQNRPQPWPQPLDPDGWARRHEAARLVDQARQRHAVTGRYDDDAAEPLLLDGEELVAGWDADIDRLLTELVESRAGQHAVRLPDQLSASAILRLRADPDAFAAEVARPMPRPPSRGARFGTRFHLWVEQHFGAGLPSGSLGQQQLIDPDDLSDRADSGTQDEAELRELCAAFVAGQFGGTVPYAIEAPFAMAVAGRLIRGRIDAVYSGFPDRPRFTRFQVVDWKTNKAETADPLQLAIYRLAWAEAHQIPVEEVDAVFYYVRSDRVVRPDHLPGRADLERLLGG